MSWIVPNTPLSPNFLSTPDMNSNARHQSKTSLYNVVQFMYVLQAFLVLVLCVLLYILFREVTVKSKAILPRSSVFPYSSNKWNNKFSHPLPKIIEVNFSLTVSFYPISLHIHLLSISILYLCTKIQ